MDLYKKYYRFFLSPSPFLINLITGFVHNITVTELNKLHQRYKITPKKNYNRIKQGWNLISEKITDIVTGKS